MTTRRGFFGWIAAAAADFVGIEPPSNELPSFPHDRWFVNGLCEKEISAAIFKALGEFKPTATQEMAAIDAINDFTRIKIREEGFYRRIMPPISISNDELDRAVPTPPFTWEDFAYGAQQR